MTTVTLVYEDMYGDEDRLVAIFATEVIAQAYIEKKMEKSKYYAHTMAVQETPECWFHVLSNRNGDKASCMDAYGPDTDGRGGWMINSMGFLRGTVIANNSTHALQIANAVRQHLIETGEWPEENDYDFPF